MRKKSDSGASLELLLDTMCNAFGGVMFIAISLIVVTAAMPKQKTEQQPRQQQLQIIQQNILEETIQVDAQTVNDRPDSAILHEIIQAANALLKLESELKIKLIEEENRRDELRAVLSQNEQLNQEIPQIQASLHTKKTLSETLHTQVEKLRQEVKALPEPQSIVYKKYKNADTGKVPFFFVVSHGNLYRLGPNENGLAHSDVSTTRVKNFLHCVPVSGVPVLQSDGAISPECINRIRAVGDKRFASFKVYDDSTESFFALCVLLKKENIRYFWSANDKNQKCGIYYTSDKVEYEN